VKNLDKLKAKKISEEVIKGKCLNCGHNELIKRETVYEVPNFGKYYLMSLECKKCGFTYKDYFSLEEGKPKKLKIILKDKEALNSLFVRGEDAKIYVKNLDLEVKPIEGEPLLTTFEGFLNKLDRIIKIMDNEKIKKKFEELKEVKEPIEIIIEDPKGISKVIEKKGQIEVKEIN
jgi:zinc finger protein